MCIVPSPRATPAESQDIAKYLPLLYHRKLTLGPWLPRHLLCSSLSLRERMSVDPLP